METEKVFARTGSRSPAFRVRQALAAFVVFLILVPWAAGALTEVQYVQLKTELTTDPLVPPMGYNVTPTFYVTNNNDAALADMLNAIGTTAAFQVSNVITNAQLWNAAVSGDLENLPTPKRTLLQIALQVPSFDLGVQETHAKLLMIFPDTSATYANVLALQHRQGSRAEVLFGRGTTIRTADVACALRGTGCP